MSDTKLELLIAQCKNNDVDIKVDALSKLQVEFESGIEIADPDPLISVLKTCLRTSNQHLTTATLSALPPLLPLIISRPGTQPQFAQPTSASSSTSSAAAASLIDASTLRHVITAFLPNGGVLDRLGDAREKSRDKARETLVVLGGLAFRGGGASSSAKAKVSGNETPLMTFERYLRDVGLASKVWRVREQAILILVQIRRAHHLFPIRPYLPQLVTTLEDTDGNVRECARQSVVELFTGPAVTDGARGDLKKEMTKKGVRKNIVDSVLAKLLAGGNGGTASYPASEGSENGDTGAKKDYVPPSLALQGRKPVAGLGVSSGPGGVPRNISYSSTRDLSRPISRSAMVSPAPTPGPVPSDTSTEVKAVYITSARDMESEFEDMVKHFDGKESEHNWAAREKSIQRVRGMLKGDAHHRYADAFLACLRDGFIKISLKALASLRTTVSCNTCSLYSELTMALGHALDPFCETLLTPLLRMASFTKKIVAQQSQSVVTTILTHTSPQPRMSLQLLSNTLQEKTVQARAFVIAHIKNYVEVHGTRSKSAIDSSGGAEILEKCMKRALADANVGVRESARVCFWVFESVWHERAVAILGTLDSLARKQLEKVCPDPNAAAAIIPPTTPKNLKKTSVAAAIAASRAKAKAIATSPPTLRHQATSTSHAVRATSPTPGLHQSGSPPTSPRSRILSGSPIARTASSPGGVPRSHSRSTSSSSTSTPPEAIRRATSSPLAGSPPRNSVLRRATETALPASPPPSTTNLVQHSPIHYSPTARRTNTPRVPAAVPVPPRPSTIISMMNGHHDDSLLLANEVPIPEDSDSDESLNLMSFSTPFETYPPFPLAKSDSQVRSLSPKSTDSRPNITDALSTPEHIQGEIVEDALRARAEQAESAAERLLELVDSDDSSSHHPSIPASLLVGGNGHASPNLKVKYPPNFAPPVTPVNRNTRILKQAALFQNSPAYNGTAPSLVDVLKDRKNESSWWLKRVKLIEHGTPLKAVGSSDRIEELEGFITALEQSPVSVRVLQKLALLCIENPVADASSPTSNFSMPTSPSPFETRAIPPLHDDIWTGDKRFQRLFNALIAFLEPSRSEEELEYGLIVLWEMVDHQALYVEGREADIFNTLLTIRYCNKINVLEATNTVRDALTLRIEPVYGLTTMHASLKAFQMTPPHPSSDDAVKAASCAFGLLALGKFLLRLPGEVLEDELPRLSSTLVTALNDKSSLVIRESAATSIIAAQLVLRDETHLFALLDGLADDKKNLLTYLFDKHGTMGHTPANGSGTEKLEKEMRRLDNRTNASPRPTRNP